MKKKILFIAPNLNPGGAESVLTKIINNFDKNNYIIKLVLLKKTGSLLKNLDEDVTIIDLNVRKSILSPVKLYRILKTEQPDIVFSIIGQINLLLAFLKVIAFNQIFFIGRENAVYSEWLFKERNIKKIALKHLYKVFLKKLDVVIVQSNFMRNQVINYFNVPAIKTKVLKNPLEHEKIKKLSDTPITEISWNSNKINLLAVGRIEKVKNYKDMIDIVAMLPKDFHLNILGEGNEKDIIQRYIDEKEIADRVTLYGFVENPYKFMKNSFAILLTSIRESLPNVVLEANACGTYAFSYDIPGGISEIIVKNKINGVIVEFGDKKGMKEAIIKTYDKGYDKKSIVELTNKFSIEEYLDNLYEIIDDMNR